jgi:hypothetical protein
MNLLFASVWMYICNYSAYASRFLGGGGGWGGHRLPIIYEVDLDGRPASQNGPEKNVVIENMFAYQGDQIG